MKKEIIKDNKELFTGGGLFLGSTSKLSNGLFEALVSDNKDLNFHISHPLKKVAESYAHLTQQAPAMYRLLEKISEWIGVGHDEECCQMQEEIYTILNKANPKT